MVRPALLAEQLWRDVVLAARRLRKTPLFTGFSVLSLAAGVAVTASVYALVASTLWQPSGVKHPDTLMVLATQSASGPQWRRAVSAPDVADFLRGTQSFAAVATSSVGTESIVLGPTFEPVIAEAVSGRYFDVLGVAAARGRLIGPADDIDGAPPVVVLSDRLWRRAFASDPDILGQTVRLADRSFEVIGVAETSFSDPLPSGPSRSRAWIPASAWRGSGASQPDRARRALTVVGRLRPGVSIAQASAEALAIGANLDAQYPLPPRDAGENQPTPPQLRRWTVAAIDSIQAGASTRLRVAGYGLIGIAGLVLIVACTNLANLSLARGASRRHEFAVRRALGASRWRLARGLAIESALVALLGAGLAVVFLRLLVSLFTIDLTAANQNTLSLAPSMTAPVLVFSAVAVLLSLVIFGVQPALQLTRASERSTMAASAHTVVAPPRGAWRLLRWQVAIACGLLLLASVAVQYVVLLSRQNSGIDLDRLAVGTIVAQGPRWPAPAARAAVQDVLDRLAADPTIESAAAATGMPFGMSVTPYALLRDPQRPNAPSGDALLMASTPATFQTLGIRLEAGRPFTDQDAATAPPVAILSAAAASEIWGTTDVIGRTIDIKNGFASKASFRPATIVGIAADTDVQSRLARRSGLIYVPLTQDFSPGITFAVRTADPAAGIRALRAAVFAAAPDLVLTGAGPAEPMLAPALALTRLAVSIALSLGGLALGLCMIGLHGVLAHLLASRSRELGLRIALGATSADLRRMTLLQGLRPVAEGLAIGLVLGSLVRLGLHRLTGGSVALLDPLAFVLLPILFALVGWLACLQPVRRASRVDPNVVLKDI